jgi:hypothetical protein
VNSRPILSAKALIKMSVEELVPQPAGKLNVREVSVGPMDKVQLYGVVPFIR